MTNDIWFGTGDLPDITMAKRIFLDGRLATSSALEPYIGARFHSPGPGEVLEKGVQVAPVKPPRAGATNAQLFALLRKNFRTPEHTMGHLWAQVIGAEGDEAAPAASSPSAWRAADPARSAGRGSMAGTRTPSSDTCCAGATQC